MRKSRQIIAYLGVSIDGRIAGMGHDIDWLLDYDPYEFGFADFLANVDTLIAGRTSFEIMRHDWAYGDRRCLVISRTPLDQNCPPNCVAVLSPARRWPRPVGWPGKTSGWSAAASPLVGCLTLTQSTGSR